ncbi:MAG TPA: hypothetical protein VL068_04365, partial [Microthrixaceae bacterium]|nr:hypothetical protein [Microthrixaceae bacterium]
MTSDRAVVSKAIFEGIDTMPAVFFDSVSYSHISPGMGLRGDEVMIMHAADKTVQVIRGGKAEDPVVIDHLPEPSGEWSGFRFSLINLTGCTALTVGNEGTQRRISVSPLARPALRGVILDNVISSDGAPVISDDAKISLPPSPVPWTAKVTVDDTITVIEQSGDSEVDLTELLPTNAAAQVAVNARGVLGSDLRTTFTWIPSLKVSIPARLALPGEPPPTISIDSPNVEPLGADGVMPILRRPELNDDSIDLQFPGSNQAVGVRVQLPRLRWGLVKDGKHQIDSAEIRLSTLDFDGAKPPGITASVGRRDVPLELLISSHKAVLQRSRTMLSSGPRGLCMFDLGRFGDTLRGLDHSVEITLLVGNAQVPVRIGVIRPDVTFSNVTISSRLTGAEAWMEVRFTQQKAARDRALRLWPLGRPWDRPTNSEIPDDADSSAEFILNPAPPPGEYLAEVVIDDKWIEPLRPHPTDAGVVRIRIGDQEQATADLSRRAADEPEAVIESIVLSGRPCRPIVQQEIKAALRPALIAWVAISRSQEREDTRMRGADELLDVISLGRPDLPH